MAMSYREVAGLDDLGIEYELASTELITSKAIYTSNAYSPSTSAGYAVTSNTLNTVWPSVTTYTSGTFSHTGATLYCVECAFYDRVDGVPGPYMVGGNSLCHKHAEGRMHLIEETP